MADGTESYSLTEHIAPDFRSMRTCRPISVMIVSLPNGLPASEREKKKRKIVRDRGRGERERCKGCLTFPPL